LDDLKKRFNDSFNYAVILLGAFFGFRKFYDIYYEVLNLRFYKDFKKPLKQPEKEEQQEKVDTILETDNSVKTVTEAEQPKAEQPKEEQQEKVDTILETDNSVKTVTEEEQPKAEQPKEKQLKAEQPKEEQLTKRKTTKRKTTKKNDKIKDDAKVQSIIKKMIEQALEKKTEIKLADIAAMIKTETGKTVQIRSIEKVAKQMNGIEIIKIGKAKGVKRTTGTLFNGQ
jgi:FtsZ-interacting cell division protein ZipA